MCKTRADFNDQTMTDPDAIELELAAILDRQPTRPWNQGGSTIAKANTIETKGDLVSVFSVGWQAGNSCLCFGSCRDFERRLHDQYPLGFRRP